MNGRRIATLVAGLLLLTGAAVAQDEERYRLPDRPASSADFEALLRRRLAQFENDEQTRKLIESLARSGVLDQFRNEEVRKQVEETLRQRPDLRKDVENVLKKSGGSANGLKDLIQKALPEKGPGPGVGPGPMPIENPGKQPENKQPENKATAFPTIPAQPRENLSDWFSRQASSWASHFTGSLGNLDNATLRGLVEQFQKSGLMPSKLEMPDWLRSSVGSVPANFKGWLPSFGGMQMPTPNFGSVDWSNLRVSSPSLSLPSAAGTGRALGLFLLVGLLALIAWVLWQTRGLGVLDAVAEARRLGPWPVAPGAVATRGEVVLAFEYLARKVLGLPAESWHHRRIAERLAERAATTAQQQAAAELGELYEQARYTPPEETLAPDEVARARAALRLLATVNAA